MTTNRFRFDNFSLTTSIDWHGGPCRKCKAGLLEALPMVTQSAQIVRGRIKLSPAVVFRCKECKRIFELRLVEAKGMELKKGSLKEILGLGENGK